MTASTIIAAVLMSCLSLAGCEGEFGANSKPDSAAAAQQPPQRQQAQTPAARETMPVPKTPPAPRVNPQRAMQFVKDVVNIGARSLGSSGHAKVQTYIKSKLKNDHVEEDVFTAQTPAGAFEARNIIAKFPGTKDGIIVIGSHYDTNYPLKNYVGANDGGSTTGLLLELANQLRGTKREGYSVWLVWFDAEEAVKQWSPTDSLYGSRHLADKWQQEGTLPKIKAFILLDMIGDADLAVDDDANSTPWLKDLIHQAATVYGYQSHFFQRQIGGVEDDHLPFMRKGVPAVDLIDFEYGYNNVYHHTPQDTLDKLSPNSLQVIGDTVLEAIRLINAR